MTRKKGHSVPKHQKAQILMREHYLVWMADRWKESSSATECQLRVGDVGWIGYFRKKVGFGLQRPGPVINSCLAAWQNTILRMIIIDAAPPDTEKCRTDLVRNGSFWGFFMGTNHDDSTHTSCASFRVTLEYDFSNVKPHIDCFMA